jgi:hypothetical protein
MSYPSTEKRDFFSRSRRAGHVRPLRKLVRESVSRRQLVYLPHTGGLD